jgi:methyl-accepting chemotaxis protein
MTVEQLFVEVDEQSGVEHLLADLGELSGDLSLQCSATGGFLGKLNRQIEAEAARLVELNDSMTSLDAQHVESKQAAEELLLTATVAHGTLAKGNEVATRSLGKVEQLIGDVTGLEGGLHTLIRNIEAIGGITKAMREIAHQTRTLGFNARLEAERGGAAAKPFAVIADEIRRLATITADSSNTVALRIAELEKSARRLIDGVEQNIARGRQTSGDIDSLRGTLADMAAFVTQFHGRSEAIMRCTEASGKDVQRLSEGLAEFQQVAADSAVHADEARQQLDALESRANDMLNQVAHGGVRTRNSRYIDLAREGAAEVSEIVRRALELRELTMADLFDANYRAIPGTDPVQFDNGFAGFADLRIRPVLDYRTAQDRAIVGCCLVDMNGYLPTHITARSEKQRPGERKRNLEFSRNRQIFMDTQTRRALDDDGEFFVYAYRQDLGDGRFRALRSVLVPLVFEGRKWGLYEVGYLI